jgi:general secretion pathway protein J
MRFRAKVAISEITWWVGRFGAHRASPASDGGVAKPANGTAICRVPRLALQRDERTPHPRPTAGSRLNRARGFTLMEVLVALVLLTLFSLATFRALDAVLNAQRQASAEMAHWNELAAAFAWMDSDLSNAAARVDPKVPRDGGFHIQLAEDGAMQFDLVRQLPEDADQALQRVGYRCAGKSLERLVWADVDNPLAEARKSTLLEGLGSCAFRYLNELGQWLPTWQPQGGNVFPRAVELNIDVADGTRIRRVLRVQ